MNFYATSPTPKIKVLYPRLAPVVGPPGHMSSWYNWQYASLHFPVCSYFFCKSQTVQNTINLLKKGLIKHDDQMQGYNARKLISEVYTFCTHFLYYSVLSLGGKVNTRGMSQPDMESIFTKIIYEIFWS